MASGLNSTRRRLSVLSDNKLVEGFKELSTDNEEGGAVANGEMIGGCVTNYGGRSKKGYAPYNPHKQNQVRGPGDGVGRLVHARRPAFASGFAIEAAGCAAAPPNRPRPSRPPRGRISGGAALSDETRSEPSGALQACGSLPDRSTTPGWDGRAG